MSHLTKSNSKARSTKTRIETYRWLWFWDRLCIRKQDPLKQGLKHALIFICLNSLKAIRKQDPLKQGLKHSLAVIYQVTELLFESKIH